MYNKEKYKEFYKRSEEFFNKNKEVYCPYFDCRVVFSSDGFHHLRYSARCERDKNEQIFKFSFLPAAINIIKKSGTVQEYRKELVSVNKKPDKSGLTLQKIAEYWGFVAIVGKEKKMIRIKVILKRIGDGNIIFWSIMPAMNLKGSWMNRRKRLADKYIKD